MISDHLPDGRIIVIMTPREAVHIHENTLDPADFPWNRSESQETAAKFRMALMAQIMEGTQALLSGIAGLPEIGDEDDEGEELVGHAVE